MKHSSTYSVASFDQLVSALTFYALLLVMMSSLLLSAVRADGAGLSSGDRDPKTGKIIKYWVAPMDPTYIRNQPGKSPMGMDLVPVYEEEGGEKEPTSTIRIDPVTVQNMGVRTSPVVRRELKRSIRALGTVTYDETKIYAVNLKFDGWVEKLFVDFVGESVEAGQPLLSIYSPELVTAQEEYLLAFAQFRELGAAGNPLVSDNSRRLLAAARQRLAYWDMTRRQIDNLTKKNQVEKALVIHSPARGVVTGKEALAGHFAKAGSHLYEIADLSSVWVDVEIYEYELPFVKKGMDVSMELSYLPGARFHGKVLFIYPFLNPKTRTVRLRLSFDNPDMQLRPDMYANVYLDSLVDPHALVIPQEAVIDSGLRKLVFVALGKGRFEPREVRLGIEGADDSYQVLEGLSEGEEVVTSAQFMFDSESRLREAIQKMLEARSATPGGAAADKSAELAELDMSGMTMDGAGLSADDLNMGGLTMESQDSKDSQDGEQGKPARKGEQP